MGNKERSYYLMSKFAMTSNHTSALPKGEIVKFNVENLKRGMF